MEYTDDQPHLIITTASDWHSEAFATRADALAWLDRYGVSRTYKEEHYSTVNANEYWQFGVTPYSFARPNRSRDGSRLTTALPYRANWSTT